MVGAVAFLNGILTLFLLTSLPDAPRRRLFETNVALGTAIVTISLGGMLVYQAASSLGKTPSNVMRVPNWRAVAPFTVALFVVLVGVGQWQVNHPERLPWLFPITNVLIVSLPSLAIALVVSQRYLAANAFAWPISWREWSTGIIYGAVGSTTVAGIINTAYLVFMGLILIATVGEGDSSNFLDGLRELPRGWGIAFDLSVLSVVAPLNEEFWKGTLVAFFFFRKGGAGRCFLWGVLAGAGFNILETFQNSLAIIDPEQVSQQQLNDEWWLFATARAGTGAVHSTATGFSALGLYGLLRHRPKYMLGYPAGVLIHGLWNFLNFTLAGDAFLSQAGPDSRLLDVLSVAGLGALFLACLLLLWTMPARVRDGTPAALYRLIGMVPATGADSRAASPPGA